jgi:hypothetical protein
MANSGESVEVPPSIDLRLHEFREQVGFLSTRAASALTRTAPQACARAVPLSPAEHLPTPMRDLEDRDVASRLVRAESVLSSRIEGLVLSKRRFARAEAEEAMLAMRPPGPSSTTASRWIRPSPRRSREAAPPEGRPGHPTRNVHRRTVRRVPAVGRE